MGKCVTQFNTHQTFMYGQLIERTEKKKQSELIEADGIDWFTLVCFTSFIRSNKHQQQ